MPFDVGGVTLTSPGTTLSVNDAAAVNWMQVNASGILTRPQTPHMRGQIQGQAGTYNAGGTPLLVTADVQVGNCWNNATGLFTCPVAGYYLMCMCSIVGPAGSGYIDERKNNSGLFFTHWSHGSNWHFVSLGGIILANANDYLSWHVSSQSPANAGVHGNGNHSMYSISLLA